MTEQQDKSPSRLENKASIRRITQQFMRGEISEEEYERRTAEIRTEGGAVVGGGGRGGARAPAGHRAGPVRARPRRRPRLRQRGGPGELGHRRAGQAQHAQHHLV